MRKMKVWINNNFVNMDEARVSILDRGFLYGDGLFETMRSYAGVVFRLEEHLSRLLRSLEIIRIRPQYSKKYLRSAVYACLKINSLKSAYIRISVTRGEGRFGIFKETLSRPSIVVCANKFEEFNTKVYESGINAKVVKIRQNEYSPISKIKSLNFLNNILARFSAKDDSFDEAILMNTRGYVAEGATSNIFLVRRKTLLTPSLESSILPGVTRRVIIELAKRLNLTVKEKFVLYQELITSDEVFLTNSLVEVLPVVKVDSKIIGKGSPGEITKLLRISYQKQVIREVLG